MNLAEVVAASRCLLIDFDGPLCSVFAGHPARGIAKELQAVIRRHRDGELPPALVEVRNDPIELLAGVRELGDEQLTKAVAHAERDEERAAVRSAAPTAGAEDALSAARAAGRTAVIVSNNAEAAIGDYLQAHHLTEYVQGVAGRTDDMDPRFLKPHPFLLKRGLAMAGARLDDAIFVGDSVTDVEAGRAAGIPTVGYANKPGKREKLAEAGAVTVIDSMHQLAEALVQVSAEAPR
ncbi:hydrolase [Paractinoplanes deccanensis]|uniref:Hydrolase n=1 Tax=Paractinoplanes deccanensis TaxID=113561 RepID=A0ABQ3YFK2_9ACTN|nr:HAD family hydrolase [Actinoplanes deccanensis]GID78762.1 hydrolase [Actinoplanes deccanensis]